MKNSESPAFPTETDYKDGVSTIYHGLTKREYFAAMAICAGKSAKESLYLSDELLKLLNDEQISEKVNE